MIVCQWQDLLKAQAQLNQLVESIRSAAEESQRVDQVEREQIRLYGRPAA